MAQWRQLIDDAYRGRPDYFIGYARLRSCQAELTSM